MKLSVVILSMTKTKDLFKMTLNCINSLIDSETNKHLEIILIESNKNYSNFKFKYPEFVKVIIPDSEFNFHKFLNIGIKASRGNFIALCNNDLIFYKNWFTEILKIKKENPSIKSFSPSGKIDDHCYANNFEIGYKVRTHIMGWCIVANKEIFSKIKYLDETFDFYYADNDYAMTLKKYNIKHAIVNTSKVKHIEKEKRNVMVDDIEGLYNTLLMKAKADYDILPKYVFTDEYKWLFKSKRGLVDNLKFHKKWGDPNFLYRKNIIADILIEFKLGFLNKYVMPVNFRKFKRNWFIQKII